MANRSARFPASGWVGDSPGDEGPRSRRLNDDDEPGAKTEWRVTWFPLEGPPWEKSKRGTEQRIRAIAKREAEANPIIEFREIVVGEWRGES